MAPKQALVIGSSGVGGWSLIRELLVYPDHDTFTRIIGLCHREVAIASFYIDDQSDRDRLHLCDGLDLTKGTDSTIAYLKQIPDIQMTTDVFYAAYGGHLEAYSSENPHEVLKAVNTQMLTAAIDAITSLCPQLDSWILQTGGKSYGWELMLMSDTSLTVDRTPLLPGLNYTLPLKENHLPITPPYGSMLFYNDQYKLLTERSQGKSWKFVEILPGIIVGHAPTIRFTNMAQLLGLWLSLYVYIKGEGAEVRYPGTEKAYKSRWSDCSQDTLARFEIFISLNQDAPSGERYNIADCDEGESWEEIWPELCELFGLKGLAPREGDSEPQGADWVMAHQESWSGFEDAYGLRKGMFASSSWFLLTLLLREASYDRQYSLQKAHSLGFREHKGSVLDGYRLAFTRMRVAKMIP